jgi:hypothetical protein
MIKRFQQYNESIRDKMEPKSDEEVKNSIDKYLNYLKSLKDDPEYYSDVDLIDTYINILIQIIDIGELIKILVDDGTIDPVELLYAIMSPGLSFNNEYFYRIQGKLLDRLYDIIVDNKEKLTEVE